MRKAACLKGGSGKAGSGRTPVSKVSQVADNDRYLTLHSSIPFVSITFLVLRSGQWTWVMHLLGEMLEVAVQPNVFWLFMNKTAALLRIQSLIQMALLASGLYLWLCYQLLRKGISMARGTSTAWHCSRRGQRLRLQRCYQRAYG